MLRDIGVDPHAGGSTEMDLLCYSSTHAINRPWDASIWAHRTDKKKLRHYSCCRMPVCEARGFRHEKSHIHAAILCHNRKYAVFGSQSATETYELYHMRHIIGCSFRMRLYRHVKQRHWSGCADTVHKLPPLLVSKEST